MNGWFWFYWKLRACTTIHIITATVNKAVKEIHNCILHLFMVLLPENIFSKILTRIHKFVLYASVSVESQVEKNSQWLPTSSRKREEQTRSGAAKAKLTTCWYFSLRWFLHSVVNRQNTDSNVAVNFCKNKIDGQEAVKVPLICTLSEKSSNQRSNVFLI